MRGRAPARRPPASQRTAQHRHSAIGLPSSCSVRSACWPIRSWRGPSSDRGATPARRAPVPAASGRGWEAGWSTRARRIRSNASGLAGRSRRLRPASTPIRLKPSAPRIRASTSSHPATRSDSSRSKRSAQRWLPVSVETSCTLIRRPWRGPVLPSPRTASRSATTSTPSTPTTSPRCGRTSWSSSSSRSPASRCMAAR